jgi:uncharacterized damage-inducible protein DinB
MTRESSTVAVAALVRMADSAFDGQHWHATIRNLSSLNADDWDWAPPDGERTIRELVRHIGKCKVHFADQLFGDGTRSWEEPIPAALHPDGNIEDALAWLREAHKAFRDGIAGLSDADLSTTPSGYWNEPRELQWSIEVMIQHEVYHTGEINHIRALHQGNDFWD